MSRGLGKLQIKIVLIVEDIGCPEDEHPGDVCIECPTIADIVSHLPGYDHDITPHTYRQVATAIRQLAYGTRANLLAGVADGRQILETEYEDELATRTTTTSMLIDFTSASPVHGSRGTKTGTCSTTKLLDSFKIKCVQAEAGALGVVAGAVVRHD
jgi:hypothetical protein